MSTERELLQQAHEICLLVGSLDLAREIKAALARPEQIGSRTGSDYQQGFEDGMAEARLASELSHPEQEPVAWMIDGDGYDSATTSKEIADDWRQQGETVIPLDKHPQPKPFEICKTHGPGQPNVWACPECLRELRNDNKRFVLALNRIKTGSGDAGSRGIAYGAIQSSKSLESHENDKAAFELNEHFQKPIGELEISLSGFSFHPEDKSFLLTNMPIGEYPLYTDPQPLKRLADTESLEISKQFGGMSTREWGIVAAFEKAYGIKEKL
jgi:hypothetical protein